MGTSEPGNARPQDDQPSTEEALPGVELGSDEETEETAKERLGPDAAERAEGAAGGGGEGSAGEGLAGDG
jgi:hypothetical protein